MSNAVCKICTVEATLDEVVEHIRRCKGLRLDLCLRWSASGADGEVELADGIRFRPRSFCLVVRERVFWLSGLQGRLLTYLYENRGSILTRDQTIDAVWGTYEAVDPREVDVFIARLRRKLGAHPSGRHLIRTVRGIGYGLFT